MLRTAAACVAAALALSAGAAHGAQLTAAAAAAKVTSLPGLAGPLSSNQYSGFLEVNNTRGHERYLHYWFVEATKSNPETSPVVLWLNGGPGCSSLDGYLYEHGPYHFGSGLTLQDNPWAWTQNANVIYLEAPAGVGFSYSKDPSVYNHEGDNFTAADNHRALQLFFETYPQFKNNDLIIAGESYAGIYVPTLANLAARDPTLKLKGIMVGNGVTSDESGSIVESLAPFLQNHQVATPAMLKAVEDNCVWNQQPTAACTKATNAVLARFEGLNIYDIYLPCFHNSASPVTLDLLRRAAHGYRMDVPCIDSNKATTWLNEAPVKEALHVNQSPNSWTICNVAINSNWTSDWTSVVPLYKFLLDSGVKVLVYSGDVDGAVPITGTRAWIDRFVANNDFSVQKTWEPWFIDMPNFGKQVGGYESVYAAGSFSFTSIFGAGHMTPQFRPQASYEMLQSFISKL